MANFSFKSKKFPLKAVPTVVISFMIGFLIVYVSSLYLREDISQLDLKQFELEELDYKFQTILENKSYEIFDSQKSVSSKKCLYYAQSGSFRSQVAAQSQINQLNDLGYKGIIETVDSSNGYNFKVIIGPFQNRSQTNNAREIFRQQNMDSIEIHECKENKNES